MKKLVWFVATLAMLVVLAPRHADAADYVGSKKCKMCHKNAFTAWEGSKHAQAFATMEKEGATGKPECVKCHTTGYAGSGAVTEDQKNVGCERCHGPGSGYMKLMMKKATYTTEAAQAAGLILPGKDGKFCTDNCHNSQSPNFKPFNFEERWGQIKHELDKPRAH
ncbi:MAG: hypothetical protein COW73_02350 [Nitrospirae bacterium CG18_big_fil_WC_8_21_14_2_50_70_55]|nr:hypothetical protein [Deltaproteobacteria bacterium]OIP65963.1 MAG: hypothetical protein AUK30_03485 [Nitrospirae bacterium CG2_30_70_394]PIQ06775.1 MAG: hypothetical protein COW73_02350 [Nitrospirae bacterium CG18_big_fil_WC_8_21_14_2_50_70_55]PIU80024.1 MAG: hypothetical protein COS73_01480 [Nitrospirae bacterium CG06_land_8_20_14_3_00_70_43]PIW83258.1 MAG: hypothetical protein COZ96_04310 [Nitrospirae bacterium CG_4_8_14_3_um_filter_70_85]PIX82571.1 MAG: hypothetical protein COZ33_09920 